MLRVVTDHDPSVASFTPFLPELSQDVERLLRRLFALGSKAPLRWFQRPDLPPERLGPIQVELHTGLGVITLDLQGRNEKRPAWVSGRVMQLSYGLPAGVDAKSVEPVLERFAKAFRAREAETADPLAAALARVRSFAEVKDHMYRQVSTSAGGLIGTIRLGFRCNQDCGFCWQDRGWGEPPHELYFTWLDEMAALGIDRLSVSGGEPTVHKALTPLIDRAVSTHGMGVTLETNAIQLRRPRKVAELYEAGLRELFVSFHSQDPEVSDDITRAPGTHKQTVKGIRAALEGGMKVTLNCVVERRNFATLGDHARFIAEHFVHGLDNPVHMVTYTHPCAAYDDGAWQDAVVPHDEVSPHLVEAADTLDSLGIRVEVMGTCGFPVCVVHDAPHLMRSQNMDEVNAAAREGRTYVTACESCAARRHCLGLRNEYVAVWGERGARPFAEDPDPPRYLGDATGIIDFVRT